MYKYPIVYLNKFYHCNTILADFVVPRSRCSGSRNKKIKNQNPKHNWDIKVSLETYIKSMTYIFRTWARWRSLNPWRIWCVICHATILNSVHLQRSRKLFDKILGICMSVCSLHSLHHPSSSTWQGSWCGMYLPAVSHKHLPPSHHWFF